MLAEPLGVSADEAFELLRTGARSNRIRVHPLAEDVILGRRNVIR